MTFYDYKGEKEVHNGSTWRRESPSKGGAQYGLLLFMNVVLGARAVHPEDGLSYTNGVLRLVLEDLSSRGQLQLHMSFFVDYPSSYHNRVHKRRGHYVQAHTKYGFKMLSLGELFTVYPGEGVPA